MILRDGEDDALEALDDLAELKRLDRGYRQAVANLTSVQARCTELLKELRVLKTAIDIIAPDPLDWSDAMIEAEKKWGKP